MAKFTKEQAQRQITAHFIREGIEKEAAMSMGIRGAVHYSENQNATIDSSIKHAKEILKTLKRVKGIPAVKRVAVVAVGQRGRR